MMPKRTRNEHSGANLTPKNRELIAEQDSQKHPLMKNRTLQLILCAVSGKILLQKNYQKRLSHLSQILK